MNLLFRSKVLIIDDARTVEAAFKGAGLRYRSESEKQPDYVRITRSYQEGLESLMNEGPWDLLLLDHDLASFRAGREWTGYDIMCFLEANPTYLPGKILCCSSNSVGKARIQQVIDKVYGTR